MPGSTVRLAIAAIGTLLLSLVSTSIAEAGPARRHNSRSERTVCGASPAASSTQTSKVRSFARKTLFQTRQVVHRHVMPKLQVHESKRLSDDDKAINLAVGGIDTPVLLGALEPIGMLAVAPCQSTSHRTVSQQSPRGPPWSPA